MEKFPNEYEEEPDDIASDDAIQNLLREVLREKLADTKKYPNKTKLKQALISSMLEFMTCFKLVGYDVDGNIINLTCTRSDIHEHALTHAYLDEFSRIVGSK